jgi:hypothetical protein
MGNVPRHSSVQCSTSPSTTTVNTTLRAISSIGILLPLSICAVHAVAIGISPDAINYLSDNAAANLEDSAEQRDTFVPQPNHLPLFTRGSGTR